eukprot:TRINITY_DN73004_c0_g1_i1.p1 TRINITY_DN73004_c0_g1~~TRINITY_DN73004_c0_g1_i1.p1  ORF type:complete len:199 (+),score=33.79 TRINITY_DN73004_c0_g1_i1:33-629(+)
MKSTSRPANSSKGSPSSRERKEESLDWMVGCRIWVKTIFEEEIEAEILSYDHFTNTLVLIQPGSNQHSVVKNNFKLLRTSAIQQVKLLETAKPNSLSTSFEPNTVSLKSVQSREEKVLKEMKEEAKKIGVGVTKEGQEIFNALEKTVPCKWEDKNIVVFDTIKIEPPYDVANCSGSDHTALERVKKVLEAERNRIRKN